MRTGACAVQQTLTTEAASVLKHSLSLARRRGHAQITPLHVAATLLSSRFSLLKRACLKSQPSVNLAHSSHPLQCRALELCFNVALNRLPVSPGPLLHGQPSLSNALIAALKRAQAHQRRGCIEQQQQQQPLLAIKVEVEQLVLSILDDPSVSRVMREAGFSSTAVKTNLEEISSSVSSVFQVYSSSGGIYSTPNSPPLPTTEICYPNYLKYPEDVNANVVTQVLLGRGAGGGTKRNTVIVGDSAAATDGVFNELMGKVERGQVPEELKSAHFIKFQFSAAPLTLMRREEVEANMAELKRKVESLGVGGRGVIIYTGDLKWTVENSGAGAHAHAVYNPVDHLVVEIGRLLSSYRSKVWLVGTANFQTYIKCQTRQPPLDDLWALQPVSLPSASPAQALTLNAATSFKIPFPQNQSQVLDKKPISKEEDDDVLKCCPECTSNYAREAGLNQKCFDTKGSDTPSVPLPDWLIPHAPHHKGELRRKWNRLCQNLHQMRNSVICNKGKSFLYPYNDQNTLFSETKSISDVSSVPRFRRQQSCHMEFSFSNKKKKCDDQLNLDSLKYYDGEEEISLALGNCSPIPRADLRSALHENLPWQSEVSLSIVHETLMSMSMHKSFKKQKQDWLLIQGNDVAGKRRLARVVSHALFPYAHLLCFNLRTVQNHHTESLQMALKDHGKTVLVVENIDLADPQFLNFLENGITSCQAVFILDKDDYYTESVIPMKLVINDRSSSSSETCNKDLKRRAEWDLMEEEEEEASSIPFKDLSLDLNLQAQDDESEEKAPISSDEGFLKTIKNRVLLNRDSAQEQQAKEMLLSKIKRSLEKVMGDETEASLSIDENVGKELLRGCGAFLNDLFEKWLKDILQTRLQQQVVDHRKEGVNNVRLCLGEEGDTYFNGGFMGTCLPKRI